MRHLEVRQKTVRCVLYFPLSSQCYIWWWNTASHAWCITWKSTNNTPSIGLNHSLENLRSFFRTLKVCKIINHAVQKGCPFDMRRLSYNSKITICSFVTSGVPWYNFYRIKVLIVMSTFVLHFDFRTRVVWGICSGIILILTLVSKTNFKDNYYVFIQKSCTCASFVVQLQET